MEKIDLYCLPFAGGNKYSYRIYEKYMPSFIKMFTLEYPGRATRLSEPLQSNINLLVDDCYDQIKNRIGTCKYFLYGHSMGGLIVYLLLKKILENNQPLPFHVFITGTVGPASHLRTEKLRHQLSKQAFIDEIVSFKGLPDEIVKNKEIMNFIEPILRADFKAAETYIYKNDNVLLNIPMTVLTGSEEEMTSEDIHLWQKETSFPIDFKILPGKHFFIYDHAFHVVKIIVKKILFSLEN